MGSICFALGGFFECYHNSVHKCRINTAVWWISVLNCLGGFLFLLAATSGMLGAEGTTEQWIVNFPYLIGSIFFMFGAMLALYMWKGEHYGLALISEINVKRDKAPE